MFQKKQSLLVFSLMLQWIISGNTHAEPSEKKLTQPIVRVVDLDIDEQQSVTLANGKQATVKLLKLQEIRDPIRQAVRKALVTLVIDGKNITLETGMYNLPKQIGSVQVDCSITSGYNSNGTPAFWGLDKAARIRLWPANSPLLKPGTFIYPVKQRWFATRTWYDNEPVDGGTKILPKIYYHSGLDIGGCEKKTEVIAATDAIVVSSGLEVLKGHEEGSYTDGSPVAKRYDVVYLLDERGWYYRYSHLASIAENIKPGRLITKGTRIGYIGKEGASGGWSHLHFEIKVKQPSGKWGTQAGYAFLREAYLREYQPKILANARPGHFLRAGETITLDGSGSWAKSGKIVDYEWTFADGTKQHGKNVRHRYSKPGVYHDILKVTDDCGNIDYDFAPVRVIASDAETYPTNLHAAYWPTFGIKPGDAVTFKVRSFNVAADDKPSEVWDFGDGSPAVKVHSIDGRKEAHHKNGYAITTHRFQQAGHYIVTVRRRTKAGMQAVEHLQVRVEGAKPE